MIEGPTRIELESEFELLPVSTSENSASVILVLKEQNTNAKAARFVAVRFDKYQSILTQKIFSPTTISIEEVLVIEDDNMIAAAVLYSGSFVEIYVTQNSARSNLSKLTKMGDFTISSEFDLLRMNPPPAFKSFALGYTNFHVRSLYFVGYFSPSSYDAQNENLRTKIAFGRVIISEDAQLKLTLINNKFLLDTSLTF